MGSVVVKATIGSWHAGAGTTALLTGTEGKVSRQQCNTDGTRMTHFLFFLPSFFKLDVITNPDVKSSADPATRVAMSLRVADAVNTLSCTLTHTENSYCWTAAA